MPQPRFDLIDAFHPSRLLFRSVRSIPLFLPRHLPKTGFITSSLVINEKNQLKVTFSIASGLMTRQQTCLSISCVPMVLSSSSTGITSAMTGSSTASDAADPSNGVRFALPAAIAISFAVCSRISFSISGALQPLIRPIRYPRGI